jgi:hypothetical protein
MSTPTRQLRDIRPAGTTHEIARLQELLGVAREACVLAS